MSLDIKKAADYPLSELAQLFNRAFANYIAGAAHFDAYSLAGFLSRDNVDLNFSLVAVRDGQPVGFGLIARRGWSCRLAGMGIVPEAAGQGVGKWLLGRLIEEAGARGDHSMELEAFEQNTPAVRLYSGLGFSIMRRLYGYELAEVHGVLGDTLEEVDIAEIGRDIETYAERDLPWQVSGTHIARQSPPNIGYRMEHAYAVLSPPASPTIAVRALFVPPDYRLVGEATRLLSHLFAIYPGKRWLVPAICPEEYGFIFEKFGFTRQSLNQVQMRLNLTSTGT